MAILMASSSEKMSGTDKKRQKKAFGTEFADITHRR